MLVDLFKLVLWLCLVNVVLFGCCSLRAFCGWVIAIGYACVGFWTGVVVLWFVC